MEFFGTRRSRSFSAWMPSKALLNPRVFDHNCRCVDHRLLLVQQVTVTFEVTVTFLASLRYTVRKCAVGLHAWESRQLLDATGSTKILLLRSFSGV